ncbi:UDP-N-acetylmuramoyl-L-alanyl-D-glutamate--2,6-diaminopimelate ligase [soil metagenome]
MTTRLSDLIDGAQVGGDPEIVGVTADSRSVAPGFLFAALPGTVVDGSAFVPQALKAGAAAILSASLLPLADVPVVVVSDVRRAYARAAVAFHGPPPKVCVAVTGTNGKTSVAVFCRQLFAHLGHASASLGTLGVTISRPDAADETLSGPGLTTPDAGELARVAADLARRGVTRLVLEASSHGLDQRRLDGLTLKAAGFTNLSQDHLDYHGDMAAYRAAKLRLFDTLLPPGAPAVLNADSPDAPAFARAAVRAGSPVMTVGETGGLLRLLERTPVGDGQRLRIVANGEEIEVVLPLAGAFQASNALVAAGLCIATGERAGEVVDALAQLKGAPGRLQHVGQGPRGGEAYVDFAHTPDGRKTVLSSLRAHARGKLIVVFGAGGDRDRGKRPLMGATASALADLVIVTDDNPRSEDPASIRAEVLAGAPEARDGGDRRSAIRQGVEALREGDVLVVAGKGHEQGQTIAGVVHSFDDAVELSRALEAAHV